MIRIPETAIRDVLQVCRRLYERGLVAGSDGNVSLRLSKDHVLATPTGMSKGFLGATDLVVCDLEGRQLQGERRLTTEIKIHLIAYAERPDVCAVVHAHPPYATAFAVAGRTPSDRLMPEAYIAVGKVALATYGTPSTDELSESMRPWVHQHDSMLLANHGATTLGRDVIAACNRMEALEQLCRITYLTQVLGNANPLGAEEMAKLDAIRGVYGTAVPPGPCWACGREGSPRPATPAVAAPALPPRTTVLPDASYVEPAVHWPGNPPVWERPGSNLSVDEAQVRDLARQALRDLGRD